MGLTLDQLLEETGIAGLSSSAKKAIEKQASGEVDFLKLAERCRRAAEAPAPTTAVTSTMAEKTAEVAVVRRMLDEVEEVLDEVGATKTASPFDTATFVKEALAAGHAPEQIAQFLKSAGLRDGVARMLAAMSARGAHTVGRLGKSVDDWAHGKVVRNEGSRMRSMVDNKGKLHVGSEVERLRRRYGDEGAKAIIEASGVANDARRTSEGFRLLGKAAPPAKTLAQGTVGGTKFSVTDEQLKRYGKPALYGIGGAAAYRGIKGDDDEGRRGRKGVVVVNS